MSDPKAFHTHLEAVLDINQQPSLYELYMPITHDVHSLFELDRPVTSHKTIIVYGQSQYLGTSHSPLVIAQILAMTPSAYMERIESLSLNRCGFLTHELYTDGHVCKHSDRINNLDCAHSISRKMLEAAMALTINRPGARRNAVSQHKKDCATFLETDHGIVQLDRALGEVARGPIRDDTINTFVTETPSLRIIEGTTLDDLMTMLPVLGPEFKRRQAEYGEALLGLAKRVAPQLFQVLHRELIHWKTSHRNALPLGHSVAS